MNCPTGARGRPGVSAPTLGQPAELSRRGGACPRPRAATRAAPTARVEDSCRGPMRAGGELPAGQERPPWGAGPCVGAILRSCHVGAGAHTRPPDTADFEQRRPYHENTDRRLPGREYNIQIGRGCSPGRGRRFGPSCPGLPDFVVTDSHVAPCIWSGCGPAWRGPGSG